MFCGCFRFISKAKAASNGLESPSTLGEVSVSERMRRSGAPSPERWETSRESVILVTPERDVVMEPSVKPRFQALNNID